MLTRTEESNDIQDSLSSAEVFRLPSDIMLMVISTLSIKDVIALSAVDKNLNRILMTTGSRVSQFFWRKQCQVANAGLFNYAMLEVTNWLEKFKNIPAILDVCREVNRIANFAVSPDKVLGVAIRVAIHEPTLSQEMKMHILKLIDLGVCVDNVLWYAAWLGDVKIMQALLEQGVDVNCILNDVCFMGPACLQGNSALAYAVFYSKADIVKMLLDSGADPTIKGELGYDVHMMIEAARDKVEIDPVIIDLLKDKLNLERVDSCRPK